MNSFFQLFFAWGLLLVFILVLYIIDKVNVIYQSYAKPDMPQTYNDGLFGELSGKSRSDYGTDGGYFVFGLNSANTKVLQVRKLVQYVGRGRDWVRSVEKRELGAL